MNTHELLMKHTTTLGHLSWYETQVDIRVTNTKIKIREIAGAYEKAFNNHKAVIKAGEDYDKQVRAIGFAILGAVSAGTLSVLSTKFVGDAKGLEGWKKLLVTEGLEDAVQAGVGNTLNIVSGKVKTINASKQFPTPTQYQRSAINAVDQQLVQVKQYINGIRQKIIKLNNTQDLKKYFASFNPETFKKKLDAQLKGLKKYPSFNVPQMQKEIEIGFWADWIVKAVEEYVPEQTRVSCYGNISKTKAYYDYNDLSKPIYKYLKKLLPKESGIDMGYGIIQYDSELKKLVNWAKKWKPARTFGDAAAVAAKKPALVK